MSGEEWKDRLRAYVVDHGDSLEFTRYFWKGCEPLAQDVIQYIKFARTLNLIQNGVNASQAAAKLGINGKSTSNGDILNRCQSSAIF